MAIPGMAAMSKPLQQRMVNRNLATPKAIREPRFMREQETLGEAALEAKGRAVKQGVPEDTSDILSSDKKIVFNKSKAAATILRDKAKKIIDDVFRRGEARKPQEYVTESVPERTIPFDNSTKPFF